MNKAGSLLVLVCIASNLFSQVPVKWSLNVKKQGKNIYKIYIHAAIDNGWHIYSQEQPTDAVALPTKVSFNSNPILVLEGHVKEIGQLEKHKVNDLDITQFQYEKEVDFVQEIKCKTSVKTTLSGTITFEVCTDKKCLLPPELPFSVAIQ